MKEKTNIIAVVNKKGGVGKTTTVVNVAAGLAAKNKKVLVVDLDQQANLSYWLGFHHDGKPTVAELIMFSVSKMTMDYSLCIRTFDENFDYIPAIESLDGIPSYLAGKNDCTNILKNLFTDNFFEKYDFIIFDCSPATDLLVTNAISASEHLLIPVQCDLMSYNKVNDVLQQCVNIKMDTDIQKYILGILATMYQKGTTHSEDVLNALKKSYGSLVFNTAITSSTNAKKAVGFHSSSIKSMSKKNIVGQEYRQIVDEILTRLEG